MLPADAGSHGRRARAHSHSIFGARVFLQFRSLAGGATTTTTPPARWEVVMLNEWILHVFESGQWTAAVAIVLLVVYARVRFNSPPTNRSGRTFALFFFGLIFYCALIFALWIVVILAVKQGSIGFYKIAVRLGDAADQEALRDFRPYAGVVAALVIVVAAHVPWVRRIDDAARAFCIKAAAIPREADRLALELAHSAEFQPKPGLRGRVTTIIGEEIGPRALRFQADGSLAARFTRAVSLYHLFVGPSGKGTEIDFANAHARSVYIRILHLSEATVARACALPGADADGGRLFQDTASRSGRALEPQYRRGVPAHLRPDRALR